MTVTSQDIAAAMLGYAYSPEQTLTDAVQATMDAAARLAAAPGVVDAAYTAACTAADETGWTHLAAVQALEAAQRDHDAAADAYGRALDTETYARMAYGSRDDAADTAVTFLRRLGRYVTTAAIVAAILAELPLHVDSTAAAREFDAMAHRPGVVGHDPAGRTVYAVADILADDVI